MAHLILLIGNLNEPKFHVYLSLTPTNERDVSNTNSFPVRCLLVVLPQSTFYITYDRENKTILNLKKRLSINSEMKAISFQARHHSLLLCISLFFTNTTAATLND